ncbi:MAG: hypothetical protein ACK5LY_02605 [Lachnospirales bacterium]
MFNKRKGFTLFEAVISLAFLSIASGVILQVFYTSSSLNQRASDIDMANSILAQSINVSKNAERVTDFFNNDEMYEYKISESATEDDVLSKVSIFYDKDWNVLDASIEIPENAHFVATFELSEEVVYNEEVYSSFSFENDENTKSVNKGVLYNIESSVSLVNTEMPINNLGELSNELLTTLSGTKYIGNGEVE